MTAAAIVMEEAEVSVRDLLQQRRATLGLSQAEVADRAGVTLSAYKQYETDRMKPPLDKAIRIAEALNFDPRDFFDAMNVPGGTTGAPDARFLPPAASMLPATLAAQPAYEAVLKVRNLADWKGIHSRHLPEAVDEARAALDALDVDELEELAVEFDLHLDPTSPDDLRRMTGARRKKLCGELVPRVLVVALYGQATEVMDKGGLEAIHGALAKLTYRGRPFIYNRAIISESPADYLYRLRWQVCAALLDALSLGKPLDLQDIAGGEDRAGSEDNSNDIS